MIKQILTTTLLFFAALLMGCAMSITGNASVDTSAQGINWRGTNAQGVDKNGDSAVAVEGGGQVDAATDLN